MGILKTIIITLLTFAFYHGHSQSIDSLSISPNPFSSTATISFGLANKDTVSIFLYNVTGLKVKTFINDSILNSGYYSINFNADSLVPGIYILSLKFQTHKALYRRTIRLENLTAIKKITRGQESINLTPNPTRDILEIPISGLKNIIITDLNGKTWATIKTEKEIISLADLQAGIYSVRVFSVDNLLLLTKKIVKVE